MKILATMPVVLVMALEFHLTSAQPSPPVAGVNTNIPYLDAQPILETLREDLLPRDLRGLTPAGRESAWPGWVSRHDSTIRLRLQRGDEDSIVNFLLYGTTFTNLPRATERDLAQFAAQPDALPDLIVRRVEDLIAGIQSPGANERLQFARQIVDRKDLDPTTAVGKHEIRRYLSDSLIRISAEIAILLAERRVNDPNVELADRLTRFRDRGLSSDTAIFPNLAVEQALQAIKVEARLDAGSVRRVSIVGPGLDFTDKHEGYDFYPPQTIQPFAVIDSLIRLGLAAPDELRVTTFDLSPRINRHLEAARQRAAAGEPYVFQLPRTLDPPWAPPLVAYWERLGDRIGDEAEPVAVPPDVGSVRLRAVRVRPAVVTSIVPRDLNIVLQRLEPLTADERFDLVIATNVLAYYDVFEQSLALVNVSSMLRPGGFLITNNGVFELPTLPIEWVGQRDVTYMQLPGIGDTIDRVFWYQRQ